MSEISIREKLHFDEPVRDYAYETVQELKERALPFVLFGAGITGEKVYAYLKKHQLDILCFCDNNPAKQGTVIGGKKVLAFAEIQKCYTDFLILISCDAFMEITEQLINLGFQKEGILYFEPDWLNAPAGQGDYIKKNLSRFDEAYHLMSDQRSRDVFLGLLNYRITHDLGYIEGLADSLPYFDQEIVSLSKNEVFLDCGAFIGDTVEDFVKVTDGQYQKIICFEPNPENAALLKDSVKRNQINNLIIYQNGLSDKKQTLHFGGTSEGGRISETGDITIECDTIDNLCYENEPCVTYIKMDIEGSEYYALLGAKKIIARDHPKLAICVYHKKDDFYTLTTLIKQLYDGYRLYFRQYELSGEETVCYAIP